MLATLYLALSLFTAACLMHPRDPIEDARDDGGEGLGGVFHFGGIL
jgi:hypothetical protein